MVSTKPYNLSGMSDKAIFHRDGIMVIQNKETGQLEPADPIVKNLECKIEELEDRLTQKKIKSQLKGINI